MIVQIELCTCLAATIHIIVTTKSHIHHNSLADSSKVQRVRDNFFLIPTNVPLDQHWCSLFNTLGIISKEIVQLYKHFAQSSSLSLSLSSLSILRDRRKIISKTFYQSNAHLVFFTNQGKIQLFHLYPSPLFLPLRSQETLLKPQLTMGSSPLTK